ncbi:MAG: outer membrane lipoprotein carrier protein LolA [Hoeflea sp.]|uniref:outer membrane lipoprotein carrier protein LolA n=1 Tax=Hoeflea sp. TaxID=1940281 RepID=UPI001D6BA5C5|nr:outer membrane lipoprotein carrier protein LolA [Hoeflea sp.]MBU4531837.1 outer membrane lipoprotein carrier protein LolA [Alphaproteobacteria bacterium]MBU4544693.1 outer membrane lipoprotein carrier protein LolA [Alphaproteobacteria bacterium]MBU4552924.1 outer membrane lipoprotein carrier protein LolA [Alphaproteobacteria bacterium]MBV1725113.1 outer membrane lipoprotein carrier protein LolA [Hoeflea sp.]MBV1761133.1 outer membrane lipoprotein carrier protein LolA [Hoeflea sp.]
MSKHTSSSAVNKHDPARRALLGAGLGLGLSLMAVAAGLLAFPGAARAQDAAQKLADHFSSVKTMTGEFIQFGPNGEQTGGKFFIDRPGKLRFNYEAPSAVRVIADGKAVVIGNRKLRTWDLYPLDKTPLKLLLSERIDLSGDTVKSVTEDPDLTTIVLGNKSIFGDSTISLMFDPKSFELKQWTIRDAQGKDTSVMIYNVQTGVRFADNVFEVPYAEVHKQPRNGG